MPKQLDDPKRVTEVLLAATPDCGFLTSRDTAANDVGAALAECAFSQASSNTVAVMVAPPMTASTDLPALPAMTAFTSDGSGSAMVTVSIAPLAIAHVAIEPSEEDLRVEEESEPELRTALDVDGVE